MQKFKHKVWEVYDNLVEHYFKDKTETVEEMLNNSDFAIAILTKYKEEKERMSLLEEKIEREKPKIIFADSFCASKTTILK